MNPIENYLRRIRIKIIARVCFYSALVLSVFLFVAVKIDLFFGFGLIIVLLLVLLFFTIPAYKNRLDLSKKFSSDFWKLTNAMSHALPTIFESNSENEVQFNIYSFDSELRLTVDSTLDNLEKIEKECWAISKKFSEMLKKYDIQKKANGYVNFDALLVGMIALWLVDYHIHGVRVSLKLYVRGYNECFSFIGDEKSGVVQRIKHSLIKQSL